MSAGDTPKAYEASSKQTMVFQLRRVGLRTKVVLYTYDTFNTKPMRWFELTDDLHKAFASHGFRVRQRISLFGPPLLILQRKHIVTDNSKGWSKSQEAYTDVTHIDITTTSLTNFCCAIRN